MRRLLLIVLLATAGCGLQEHPDFLIGRQCVPDNPMPCDEGQRCLPHEVRGTRFDDFRCRDRRSFESLAGGALPPLAFCDDVRYVCPDGLVCAPDRIRIDGGPRPNVCKAADDVFIPPTFDGGTGN